ELDLLYKLSAAGRSNSNVCRNLHRLIHREGLSVPVQIDFVDTVVRKRRPLVKKVAVCYPVIYPSSWMKFLLQNHSHLILGGVELEKLQEWQAMLSEFWTLYKHCDHDGAGVMSGPDAPPAHCTVETSTGPIRIHFAVVGVKGDWVFLRKEWYNMSSDAPWRSGGEGPTPFKRSGSPFFRVPGLNHPQAALVDPAHTWHMGSTRQHLAQYGLFGTCSLGSWGLAT
ncbi:unnamed protein product, partial [Symbiodinium sp. CCMP2456]